VRISVENPWGGSDAALPCFQLADEMQYPLEPAGNRRAEALVIGLFCPPAAMFLGGVDRAGKDEGDDILIHREFLLLESRLLL
jgi:hypothetical protein